MRLSKLIPFAILLCGVGVLAYPSVSELWNKQHQSYVVSEYVTAVNSAQQDDVKVAMYEAERYNKSIVGKQGSLDMNEIQYDDYSELLRVDGTDVIGYVSIPAIKCTLPIYSGVSAETLQNGVGHLPGTSLPIGGTDTHAVLSAHTGLPGQELFNNLDEVKVGDVVTINVLDQTLTYSVYDVEVIEPALLQPLFIQKGKDLLTLVTCTPYGVNTHRLLVHCKRSSEAVTTDATFNDHSDLLFWVVFAVIMLIVFIVSVIIMLKSVRRCE